MTAITLEKARVMGHFRVENLLIRAERLPESTVAWLTVVGRSRAEDCTLGTVSGLDLPEPNLRLFHGWIVTRDDARRTEICTSIIRACQRMWRNGTWEAGHVV
jgi:hypothetical protein